MRLIITLTIVFGAFMTIECQDQTNTETGNPSIDKESEKLQEGITGQSIFEDKEGETAIFLLNGGTFRFNTIDASLKLSYIQKTSDKKPFYGIDLKGKTNDDILSLFSKGNISPGVKVNGYFGFHELLHKNKKVDGWILIKLGYEISSFEIFDPDIAYSEQLKKTLFKGVTSSLAFNLKIGGNKLMATSVGIKNANNYTTLDKYELTTQTSFNDTISGDSRILSKKSNVSVGEYNTFIKIPINYDFFWYSAKIPRLGFYHFWRTSITSEKVRNGLGSGFYLLEKGNPFASRVGLVFELSDLAKLQDGFIKSFSINLVIGHNFSFN